MTMRTQNLAEALRQLTTCSDFGMAAKALETAGGFNEIRWSCEAMAKRWDGQDNYPRDCAAQKLGYQLRRAIEMSQ